MAKNVIINCAITGSIHIPSLSPYLPITPEQIANDSIAAAEAGAATVHLHARDPKTGQPTVGIELFEQFCQEIKARSDAVICITTGGHPTMSLEDRMMAVTKFRPELASINMGSMNFALYPMMTRIKEYKFDWEKPYLEGSKDNVFRNTFADQERIFEIMKDSGTRPEMECYDVGHLYNAAHWADRGVLEPPFWLQLIFGILGGIQPSVGNLLFMKETADKLFGDDYIWSVLAAGRHEYNLATVGAVMGGNVRIGMEDNLYVGKGQLAKSNAEMVAKMSRILKELDLQPASSQEAREILKLKGKQETAF
jgi:uncharacterized protein (DUF849 family)